MQIENILKAARLLLPMIVTLLVTLKIAAPEHAPVLVSGIGDILTGLTALGAAFAYVGAKRIEGHRETLALALPENSSRDQLDGVMRAGFLGGLGGALKRVAKDPRTYSPLIKTIPVVGGIADQVINPAPPARTHTDAEIIQAINALAENQERIDARLSALESGKARTEH